MMPVHRALLWALIGTLILPGGSVPLVSPVASGVAGPLHLPLAPMGAAPVAAGRFAFVSDFEGGSLGGWTAVQGSAVIGATPNYAGEPSLNSTAVAGRPQIEQAHRGFTAGATALALRADLYYLGGGTGYVGFAGSHGAVALVGVAAGVVWAGPNLTALTRVGAIPASTAQPMGWVDLEAAITSANVSGHLRWTMDAYVDRTDVIAATGVAVPNAGAYSGAVLETTNGTMDYTNIVLTSNQIPITIAGYNNMEGYGQGSGLVVGLLPAFTTLSATMTLTNWNVPQQGILSFQINAMNRVGTTRSTCKGFFQLGVDVDPGGRIAPWYVPDGNCVAHYFNSKHPTSINRGFPSPAGTTIRLTVRDNTTAGAIQFIETDLSITGPNRTLSASVPYTSTPFVGVYSQVEWQPCCSRFAIGGYFLNASLSGMSNDGGTVAAPQTLSGAYMVPYVLDAPPSWSLTYYRAAAAAYDQVT